MQFVRKEMAAYRLYTVVPRLLDFIHQLTNWYVRLNRSRIKGGDGTPQSLASLSALYQVGVQKKRVLWGFGDGFLLLALFMLL